MIQSGMNKLSIEKMLKQLSILYIEDDLKYIKSVTTALKVKCDNVICTSNLKEAAMQYRKTKIDIIICEFIISDSPVHLFLQTIRDENFNIPIIIISKSTKTEDLLEAIKLNLIEYIVKPIELKVLREALIKSVVKILASGKYEVYFGDNITYNIKKKLLLKDDKEIKIALNETSLLELLISNQHYAISKEEIMYAVWDDDYNISDGAFKTLLNRLRNKIGKDSIKRVSGSRYLLNLKS
jgi:DNA-binding response OmpR family regulator